MNLIIFEDTCCRLSRYGIVGFAVPLYLPLANLPLKKITPSVILWQMKCLEQMDISLMVSKQKKEKTAQMYTIVHIVDSFLFGHIQA